MVLMAGLATAPLLSAPAPPGDKIPDEAAAARRPSRQETLSIERRLDAQGAEARGIDAIPKPRDAQDKPLDSASRQEARPRWEARDARGADANPPRRAQDRPLDSARDKQEPIRVQVGLVSLYATVRDNKKHPVPDLARKEFRIFEEGQEQKIDYFSRETALPITLGLLIDTSISQEAILGAEQEAASRFLRRVLRKGDLAFVISFDVNVDLLSDFTDDIAQLERAIRRTRINAPSGMGPIPQRGPIGTKLYDAVYLASREKLAGEVGRKALVILTDGVDAGSRETLQDSLESAQRTDTVVHVIVLSDPGFYFHRGGGYGGEGVAKKLSEDTGGRAISVRSEKKLEEAFDQISEELRHQYILGYYPSKPARDGKFRKVKIETTRPQLKVLARKGYYAPKN